MKRIPFLVLIIALLTSCADTKNETIQIGENTFIYREKVYRIIESEVTELGNLRSDSISKSAVLDPKLKDYGKYSLDYVREGASTDLSAVYRGDILYFKMDLEGMNNLRDEYSGGGLTINFLDEYGFQIHSTTIEMSELIRIVGFNSETLNFEYNGKTQMSSEVYRAISSYSVGSSLREKGYRW